MERRFPGFSFRLRALAWAIGKAVPLLNFFRRPPCWPFTLGQMSRLPAGTLGAETVAFLQARHFDLLPGYEGHDAIHTLLGYDTTTTGELKLQAFMWGNRSSSFAGRVLFILGLGLVPELWPQLHHHFRRGRHAAAHLGSWDLADLLVYDIAALRQRLESES